MWAVPTVKATLMCQCQAHACDCRLSFLFCQFLGKIEVPIATVQGITPLAASIAATAAARRRSHETISVRSDELMSNTAASLARLVAGSTAGFGEVSHGLRASGGTWMVGRGATGVTSGGPSVREQADAVAAKATTVSVRQMRILHLQVG